MHQTTGRRSRHRRYRDGMNAWAVHGVELPFGDEGSADIKVDAHRQWIGVHDCRRGHAQAARQVALADTPLPLTRVVIVDDVGRPGHPVDPGPGANLDLDPRVGLDVLNPVGAPPALATSPGHLLKMPAIVENHNSHEDQPEDW